MILGDFNLEPQDKDISSFIQEHNLYKLIKSKRCFKSLNGLCIDLLLTNCKNSFMHSISFETGFSDHHHMIYTIMKTTFSKVSQIKKVFWDYKRWSQYRFEKELPEQLIFNPPTQYLAFEEIFLQTLEANAPTKIKISKHE